MGWAQRGCIWLQLQQQRTQHRSNKHQLPLLQAAAGWAVLLLLLLLMHSSKGGFQAEAAALQALQQHHAVQKPALVNSSGLPLGLLQASCPLLQLQAKARSG
jgi:hypothetical protein